MLFFLIEISFVKTNFNFLSLSYRLYCSQAIKTFLDQEISLPAKPGDCTVSVLTASERTVYLSLLHNKHC